MLTHRIKLPGYLCEIEALNLTPLIFASFLFPRDVYLLTHNRLQMQWKDRSLPINHRKTNFPIPNSNTYINFQT